MAEKARKTAMGAGTEFSDVHGGRLFVQSALPSAKVAFLGISKCPPGHGFTASNVYFSPKMARRIAKEILRVADRAEKRGR